MKRKSYEIKTYTINVDLGVEGKLWDRIRQDDKDIAKLQDMVSKANQIIGSQRAIISQLEKQKKLMQQLYKK